MIADAKLLTDGKLLVLTKHLALLKMLTDQANLLDLTIDENVE